MCIVDSSSGNSSTTAIIAGTVSTVLLFIVVIIFLVIIRRRRVSKTDRCSQDQSQNSGYVIPLHTPIVEPKPQQDVRHGQDIGQRNNYMELSAQRTPEESDYQALHHYETVN